MLTDIEQMQVKRHLGMSTVSPSLYPLTDVWLTAGQILSTLPAETETEVRDILTRLTNLETAIDGAPRRLMVSAAGSVKLNNEELNGLWREVRRWRRELSVVTGLPSLRSEGAIFVA
jgi:hypothetical protein